MSRSKLVRAFRRTQPPVLTTTSARALGQGLRATIDGDRARASLYAALATRFGPARMILADSGTSALVLALRIAAVNEHAVALPAYSCPDLLSAAGAAGVRVRLYDVNPRTLSPDLDSVAAAMARGVAAVVVVHLFGYPADIVGVADLARTHGVRVIEDAAQAAGGTLGGRRLGGFGPLSVLSFGRGKGTSGAGGGAMLVYGEDGESEPGPGNRQIPWSEGGPAGWAAISMTALQWLFARPLLYGIPSAIPFLRLGETVYHPPSEPRPIAAASAAMAAEAFARSERDAQARESVVAAIRRAAGEHGATGVESIAGGHPGYLRLPVRRRHGRPAPTLGILRGYPATLADYEVAASLLEPGEKAGSGAIELRDSVFTVPTHHRVGVADIARIADWLRQTAGASATEVAVNERESFPTSERTSR